MCLCHSKKPDNCSSKNVSCYRGLTEIFLGLCLRTGLRLANKKISVDMWITGGAHPVIVAAFYPYRQKYLQSRGGTYKVLPASRGLVECSMVGHFQYDDP